MTSVDSALTPMTVNSVARSFSGCCGRAADSASAADAPQMATAPPVSSPKKPRKPSASAAITPTPMVASTEPSTSSTGGQPSAITGSNPMRSPSRATPQRSTLRAVNSIPGRQGPASARKFIARPSSSANSITGAP